MEGTQSFEFGTVLWFDDRLGFGAARSDTGEYAYIHYKNISAEGHRTLRADQPIAFIRVVDDKGVHFTGIKCVGSCREPWEFASWRGARILLRSLSDRQSVRYMWRMDAGLPIINMVRYYLAVTPFFEVYIHQFLSDDEDLFHDHPWSFWTLLMCGGYDEQFLDGGHYQRRAPAIWFRPSTKAHRVVVPLELRGRTLSLVVASKRNREWYFHDPDTGERLTPREYGVRRGASLRTLFDFEITGSLLPKLPNGKERPTIERTDG